MTEELEKKLYKKFNKIFTQKELSLRWGFECDDGWYELIYSLCEKIQAYIDEVKCQQVIATQVKEKFGSLRFYTAFDLLNEDDVIDDIDDVEHHAPFDTHNEVEIAQAHIEINHHRLLAALGKAGCEGGA